MCRECGFTFLDTRFHLPQSEEKERYDLHNNDPRDQGYRKWLSGFAEEAVFPFIKPPARILDFGCGPEPLLASILSEKGYVVETYDKYFCDQPVSGLFQMITMTEVLEHIADPVKSLTSLKDKLVKGGMISIKTSFRPSSDDEFFKWWYRQDSTHISFFTEKSLFFLAENLSLTIEFCDGKSLVLFQK